MLGFFAESNDLMQPTCYFNSRLFWPSSSQENTLPTRQTFNISCLTPSLCSLFFSANLLAVMSDLFKSAQTSLARRKWLIPVLAAIALLAIVVTLVLLDFINNDPKLDAVREDLKVEFDRIVPPANVVLSQQQVSAKPGIVVIDKAYSSNMNYHDLRAYYDSELSRNGWKYSTEERLDGGKRGVIAAHYCKREYSASLYYVGTQPGFGWTYAMDLSWGLRPCE
jgi:hypothetical protein